MQRSGSKATREFIQTVVRKEDGGGVVVVVVGGGGGVKIVVTDLLCRVSVVSECVLH